MKIGKLAVFVHNQAGGSPLMDGVTHIRTTVVKKTGEVFQKQRFRGVTFILTPWRRNRYGESLPQKALGFAWFKGLCAGALICMTVSLHAQSNSITLAQANSEATSNAVASAIAASSTNSGQSITINPDGSISVNPTSFIPVKYLPWLTLVLFLIPILTKAGTALKAGGTFGQAVASAFADKHVQIANEISQLKARTGLAPTPAPPAPPSDSVIAIAMNPTPAPPLTSLPPVSPIGSLPVIQPNPVVPTTQSHN